MRNMRRSAVVSSSVVLTASMLTLVMGLVVNSQTQAVAPETKPPNQKVAEQSLSAQEKLAIANAEVAAAQRKLEQATERFKNGLAPAPTVNQAEVELAEARIRLATIRATTIQELSQIIIQNMETIVTNRERLWEGMQALYKAGVVSLTEVNNARIALAEGRIQLELHTLVAIREQDLAQRRAAFEAGVGTQQQVEEATVALAEARRRLLPEALLKAETLQGNK